MPCGFSSDGVAAVARSKATTKIYSGVAQWSSALERLSTATQGMLSQAGMGDDPYMDM